MQRGARTEVVKKDYLEDILANILKRACTPDIFNHKTHSTSKMHAHGPRLNMCAENASERDRPYLGP